MSACAAAGSAKGKGMESGQGSSSAPTENENDCESSADEQHTQGKGPDSGDLSKGGTCEPKKDENQTHNRPAGKGILVDGGHKKKEGRDNTDHPRVTFERSEQGKEDAGSDREDSTGLQESLREYADSLAKLFRNRGVKKANDVMEILAHANEGKRLFVCCDGTWNNASGTVAPMTNVAKLSRAVCRVGKGEFGTPKELPPEEAPAREKYRYGLFRQIVYYSSGVGSQSSLAVDSLFSGAFGKGIDTNILNAYCFLCNNFNAASHLDEIILVGFSRGAFTVRCLAHFINKVGLLRRRGLVFLQSIYSAWQRSSEGLKGASEHLDNELEALGALRMFPIRINVLAEWDTVSAVTSFRPGKKKLAFVHNEVPSNVNHAFHAISLHEKRKSFKPMLWEKAEAGTRVEQCAFVGCHSDIGGGNKDPGLSTVSLLWMVSRICDVSEAKFDNDLLFPFIAPLRKPGSLFNPLSWGKSKMRLNHLTTTPGQVNESRRGLWLLPYYLTLGSFHGKRDSFLQQFALSRKAKKDGMNKHGIRVDLEPLNTLNETLAEIKEGLAEDEKQGYTSMEKDMKEAWNWPSPVQKALQFATSVLIEMKTDISADLFATLWLTQQQVRRTWLKLEMQGDVGLEIHFTARLLHSQLTSDSRLKCGLFRQFEPNGHTQEWVERSSKVLSLAEASVLAHEMKLLEEWLKASRKLSRKERSSLAGIRDAEETDWSEIQRELKNIGWGNYVAGCTFYSSLTGLIDREFKRLGVSRSHDDDSEYF